MLIGDGWVDPRLQVNNYDSYLSSAGIVSREGRDTVGYMATQAVTRIMNSDYYDAAGYINWIIADDNVAGKYYLGMNVLNYKQYDAGNINPEYHHFLSNNKQSLGVPSWVTYIDDNQQMYQDFSADLAQSYKRNLERLLERNLRVLLYNGQNDFIVNTPGVLAVVNSLQWTELPDWQKQEKKIWKEYAGKVLGWYKHHRNLIFCLVRNAGHLLPADQPASAYYMLDKYFTNSW